MPLPLHCAGRAWRPRFRHAIRNHTPPVFCSLLHPLLALLALLAPYCSPYSPYLPYLPPTRTTQLSTVLTILTVLVVLAVLRSLCLLAQVAFTVPPHIRTHRLQFTGAPDPAGSASRSEWPGPISALHGVSGGGGRRRGQWERSGAAADAIRRWVRDGDMRVRTSA